MSNDTANAAFSKLQNTLTSPLQIDDSVTTLALKGNDPAIDVTSTSTAEVVLTAEQILQAATTQLVIDNDSGTLDITLVTLATATSTAFERAAQLQSILKLGSIGSIATLHFLRSAGGGTSAINLEDTEIMALGQNDATVLVEATDVTAATATNTITSSIAPPVYTEGTWVPVLATAGGTAPTLTTALGNYTQIGNRVLFDLLVEWTANTGSPTGAVTITLPVAIGAAGYGSFAIGNIQEVDFTTATAVEQIFAYADPSDTTLSFYIAQQDTDSIALPADRFAAGGTVTGQIQVSGQYLV